MSKKADPTQVQRFLETARALDCNEEKAAFDEKLRGITGSKSRPSSVAVGTDSHPKDNKTKAIGGHRTLK